MIQRQNINPFNSERAKEEEQLIVEQVSKSNKTNVQPAQLNEHTIREPSGKTADVTKAVMFILGVARQN